MKCLCMFGFVCRYSDGDSRGSALVCTHLSTLTECKARVGRLNKIYNNNNNNKIYNNKISL